MSRAADDVSMAALKTAVALMIKRLGGLEAAAACTRVGRSPLQEYASRNHMDRHIPADVVLDLETIAGEPLITAALARAQGYRLERLDAPRTGDVVTPVQAISRGAGELAALLLAALSDHTITPEERDAMLAVAGRVRESVDAAMAGLAAASAA